MLPMTTKKTVALLERYKDICRADNLFTHWNYDKYKDISRADNLFTHRNYDGLLVLVVELAPNLDISSSVLNYFFFTSL